MKIYQIGGSVRDKLLNRQSNDIDYVVVGATIAEMLSAGYQQVGKGFPVFLHPQTKQEYALARKEIKTGSKHTDFKFIFSPDITLEEDIQRRDFTCNALALDLESGQIIDYVNGIDDIQNKILRVVNPLHFPEDPLRILRLCRFAAQLDFTVEPQTLKLCTQMVDDKMLQHLPSERIWHELEKSLNTPHFDKFITTAYQCHALKEIFPQIDNIWSQPTTSSEFNASTYSEVIINNLQNAKNQNSLVKLAVLVCSQFTLSPIVSDKELSDTITSLRTHLNLPNEYSNFIRLTLLYHKIVPQMATMPNNEIFDYLSVITHNFRSQTEIENLFNVCRCLTSSMNTSNQTKTINLLSTASAKCKHIFSVATNTPATSMPNYNILPKNADFKNLYRSYILSKL